MPAAMKQQVAPNPFRFIRTPSINLNQDNEEPKRKIDRLNINHANRGPNVISSKASSAKQTPIVTRSKKKTQAAFRRLIEGVDDGTIVFSGDLEDNEFPADAEKSIRDCYKELMTGEKNLLHLAVEEEVDSAGELERRVELIRWILRSCPKLFTQKSLDGDEPLYLAIKGCGGQLEGDQQEEPQISYQSYRRFASLFLSDPSLEEQCKAILNDTSTPDEIRKIHTVIKGLGVDIIPYLHLLKSETLRQGDINGNTLLHVAVDVQHWKESGRSKKRVQLITELINRCPSALKVTNGESHRTDRMSPYQYHQSCCLKAHRGSNLKNPCENQTCPEIEFTLKEAYMRLTDHQEAIKYLYNGDQGLYFHLDLSELTYVKPPPRDFLKNVENSLSHMNLDTILRYVCLPKDPLLSEQSSTNDSDYDNYSIIFNWFRKKNVKMIIHLRVEDNEQLPHSDDEIVLALKDINVDVWDWVQYDLCCETIAKAAPNVKKVFLYSTGNKAVLQNWSSKDGLKILKNLEEINIKIDLRPTSGKRKNDYEELFLSRLKDIGVTVKTIIKVNFPQSSKVNDDGDFSVSLAASGGTNQTDSWFRCVERFADFITDIPEDEKNDAGNPIVKIAIIDDGVNTHEPRFKPSDIGGGISFYTRGKLINGQEKKFSHHFPSSSGHGTEMADRIRQVFPKAKLYIARLDITHGKSGEITTTAKSATQAIEWAVAQNVDIISISWTVEKTPHNQADISAMGNAINSANNQNILIFCAAKDGGLVQDQNYGYPKNFNKPVFCIGATTEHGNLLESLGSQKKVIDFGLPGENLSPVDGGPGSDKITGSSISTALASGLAGLLLYCIQFYQDGKPGNRKRTEDLYKKLKTHNVMKYTLNQMVVDQNHKYVSVPKYFDLGDIQSWSNGGDLAFGKIVKKISENIEQGSKT